MTPEEKLKLAIGDLVIRAVFAEAHIERLQAEIETLKAKAAPEGAAV